jgi:hypothetical protein
MAKNLLIAILGGVVLLGGGFGGGYLVANQRAQQPAPTRSPSPTPSATPSPESSPTVQAPPTAAPVEAGSLPQDWSLCTNVVQRFSVGYPGNWFTFSPTLELACHYFDPNSFSYSAGDELEHGQEPKAATRSFMGSSTFETHVNLSTEPADYNVLLKEPTQISGLPALRYETEYKQEGGFSEVGTKTYGFIVNRGGKAFFLIASVPPARIKDYPSYKVVIDQAIKTVKFY